MIQQKPKPSRPAIGDADRVRILELAVAPGGTTPSGAAARLNLDRADVQAVLGFCGWPNVVRMRAQLYRLKAAAPVETPPEPAEDRVARDQAAAPDDVQPPPVAAPAPLLALGEPGHPVRLDTLVSLGRRSSVKRAQQLAERLQSVAGELAKLLQAEADQRAATARNRAEREARPALTDVEQSARTGTGAAARARGAYHRAFLERHFLTRDRLAAWGRDHGHRVGEMGPVPRAVLDAYEAEQGAGRE